MTWFNRLRLRIAALFCKPKELFYINGPDTLPSPLSAEEEAVCIEHIEEDDVRSRGNGCGLQAHEGARPRRDRH